MNSRPKKSPASKARKGTDSGASANPSRRSPARRARREAAASQLPTQLERDTLLTPLWVAESVVQEVERFLQAELPENFAERLAAKADQLYPRHRHFHRLLNRPGNYGRDFLRAYMRHWTAGWLRRERWSLHKKLPWSFGNGQALPATN